MPLYASAFLFVRVCVMFAHFSYTFPRRRGSHVRAILLLLPAAYLLLLAHEEPLLFWVSLLHDFVLPHTFAFVRSFVRSFVSYDKIPSLRRGVGWVGEYIPFVLTMQGKDKREGGQGQREGD